MNNTKILIICGTLESGGAERVISTLSTPLADAFNHVTIITWRNAPVFYNIDSRVSLISLPKLAKSQNNFVKCIALRNYVKTNTPSIILSFLTLFNMLTLFALIGIKIPIIVAERNDPRFIKGGIIIKSIRNILYRRASGILCQTQSIKNYFKGKLRSKTHVIYNPIILPQSYIGKSITTVKRNRIVSIGRLHPQKNHKLLIDSFKHFYEQHKDYTLTIYGKGNLQGHLHRYIDSIGLTDVIELAGEHKNVKDLILDAKVFLLTSSYEGMPNALIESMCLGLPCISTKVSGAIDLIDDGSNGLLVNPNVIEIADRIASIVNHEGLGKNLGISATKVYDKLRIEEISKEWIKYLEYKIQAGLSLR